MDRGPQRRGEKLQQETELGGRLVLEWWVLTAVIEHLLFAHHRWSKWGTGLKAGFPESLLFWI